MTVAILLGFPLAFVLFSVDDFTQDGSLSLATSMVLARDFIRDAALVRWSEATQPFPVSAFFYSTFVTSVWLWLFVAAGLTLRVLRVAILGLRHVGRILDTDEAPLRALGFVSMILVTVVMLLVSVVGRLLA